MNRKEGDPRNAALRTQQIGRDRLKKQVFAFLYFGDMM